MTEILEIVRKSKSSSGSTRLRLIETIYYNTEINFKSRAAYILLTNYFRFLDEDYIKSMSSRCEMIEFSRDYLTKVKEREGIIICSYCGTSHLEIEYDGMHIRKEIKATIDHIVAISKGGDIFNPENIRVACEKCNTKKGDKSVDEFLIILEKEKQKNIICKQ